MAPDYSQANLSYIRPCPKEIKVKDAFIKRSYVHMKNKEHTCGPEHMWQESTVTTNRSPEGRLGLRRDTVPTGTGHKWHTTLQTHWKLQTACPKVCRAKQCCGIRKMTSPRTEPREEVSMEDPEAAREEQHEVGLCWATRTHTVCTENRDRHVGASHGLD